MGKKFRRSNVVEERSITILNDCLDNSRFSPHLKTSDSVPDIDGFIRLRDGKSQYLPDTVLVQAKGTDVLNPKKYRITKDIIEFGKNCGAPFLLFVVDVSKKKIFFLFPSELKIPKGKQSLLIDLCQNQVEPNGGLNLHREIVSRIAALRAILRTSVAAPLSGLSKEKGLTKEIRAKCKFLDTNLPSLSDAEALKLINELKKYKSRFGKYAHYLYLGNLHLFYGRTKSAKSSYDKAIRNYKDNRVAYYNLSLIHCLNSEPDKAINLLKKIEPVCKKYGDFWTKLGISYISKSDLDSSNKARLLKFAKESYEKALALDGNNTNTIFNLLSCYEQMGLKREFESLKRRAEKRSLITDVMIANIFACDEYEKYCRSLDSAHLKKMGKALVPHLKWLVDFDLEDVPTLKVPRSPYNRQTYQPILDNVGGYFYHSGFKSKAMNIWQLLIADDSSFKSAHQNLAIAYCSQGDFPTALKHIELAKENPRFSYQVFAGILVNVFHWTRSNIGYAYVSLLPKAQNYFRKAYEESGDLNMLVNEANCLYMLGYKDAALKIVSDIKQENPLHYYSNMKCVLFRMAGKVDKSPYISDLEELTRRFPSEYEHHFILGRVYSGESDSARAEKNYNLALEKFYKHRRRVEDMVGQSNILHVVEYFCDIGNQVKAIRILKGAIDKLKFVDQLEQKLNELTSDS